MSFCKVGKVNCEHFVGVVCNCGGMDLDLATRQIEVCPYPLKRKLVEEKIVLELTQDEACNLMCEYSPVYFDCFGCSGVDYKQAHGMVYEKILKLSQQWDKDHA